MKSKVKSISRGIIFSVKSIWGGFWKCATIGSSLALISLATSKLVVISLDVELFSFGKLMFLLFWNCFFIGLGMSGLKDYIKENQEEN